MFSMQPKKDIKNNNKKFFILNRKKIKIQNGLSVWKNFYIIIFRLCTPQALAIFILYFALSVPVLCGYVNLIFFSRNHIYPFATKYIILVVKSLMQ